MLLAEFGSDWVHEQDTSVDLGGAPNPKQWIAVGDPLVTSILCGQLDSMCAMREPGPIGPFISHKWKFTSAAAENEANFANCILRRIQLSKSHECRQLRQSLSCPSTARFFSHAMQLVRWTRALEKNSLRAAVLPDLEINARRCIRASFQLSVNIDFHAC